MLKAEMEFLKEGGHVGDCVRACTASIIGADRADVPHFVREHQGDWRHPWEDWLDDRGFVVVEADPRIRPECDYLACGPTVRPGGDHPAAHMVVMNGISVAHDPHPSRAGIVTVDRVYLIVPKTLT